MAHALSETEVQTLRDTYLRTLSIRSTAKEMSVSRQTVRRYQELEGWNATIERRFESANALKHCPVPITKVSYRAIDWSFLEKLFERTKGNSENLDFKKHIKSLTEEIMEEVEAKGSALDMMRLETAMLEYLNYRRFSLLAASADVHSYKTPESCAKTVEKWRNMADKALNNFLRQIKELEIKHRLIPPNVTTKAVFMGNNQINVTRE